jgi:hypothetical protein
VVHMARATASDRRAARETRPSPFLPAERLKAMRAKIPCSSHEAYRDLAELLDAYESCWAELGQAREAFYREAGNAAAARVNADRQIANVEKVLAGERSLSASLSDRLRGGSEELRRELDAAKQEICDQRCVSAAMRNAWAAIAREPTPATPVLEHELAEAIRDELLATGLRAQAELQRQLDEAKQDICDQSKAIVERDLRVRALEEALSATQRHSGECRERAAGTRRALGKHLEQLRKENAALRAGAYVANACDCSWEGAPTSGTIGDALPFLRPCAGHLAYGDRRAREVEEKVRAQVAGSVGEQLSAATAATTMLNHRLREIWHWSGIWLPPPQVPK